MQILLHLYYISRGIFGHFCAFLGKKMHLGFFYTFTGLWAFYLFIFIYYFFRGGGGGFGS